MAEGVSPGHALQCGLGTGLPQVWRGYSTRAGYETEPPWDLDIEHGCEAVRMLA